MKALYRRYRPLKLSEVVGQEQVTTPLLTALEHGKVSHAYLFIGPRGTGKTSVARIFAHEVNGFPYTLEDDYVDIIEIDGASNRGIDNIRELREKVAIAPTSGKYKVYIIDEVHMLTKEAFNALLKTLEEPPRHAIFIMATTDAYKVPVTITSRAQVYNFKLAEPSVMLEHLKMICEKEGIKISPDALQVVAKRGGGSYRDTLSLLDQISTLSDTEITKDLVISALGLASDEKIRNLLESYQIGDIAQIANKLKEIYASGIEPKTLAEELMNTIISEPKPEFLPLLAKLADIKAPYMEARMLVALTDTISAARVAPASQVLRSTRNISPQKDASSDENAVKPSADSQRKDAALATRPKSDFSWSDFTERVRQMNDAIFTQLKNADYQVTGDTLHIYPTRKFEKNILSRDNNKYILADAAEGLKIVIEEAGEGPNSKKDPLLSKISDIMGGEVRNDAGGNPF